METFNNHNANFETSSKFIVSQELSYHSAFAFPKYEPLQFIDKASGAVHAQFDLIMEDTCQENPTDQPEYCAWNKDGTRFFFLGYVDTINDLHNFQKRWKRWGRVFVVVDVANKTIVKYYQPDIKDPHWNADGTEVLFANHPTEILDFNAYCQEKTEEYATGLSNTFQNALQGKPFIQDDLYDDLGPTEFREGWSILLELPSPDANFCLRFYNYPTPANETMRLTFSLFQKHNDIWFPIFDLPKRYYLENGTDHVHWGTNSKVISLTVNRRTEFFVFDFFYRHISHRNLDNSSDNQEGTGPTMLSYPETPKKVLKQWNNKFLILNQLPRENNTEPFLYQIAFVSMNGAHTEGVAICQDFLVENPETIKISDSGWTSFPAHDPSRSKHFLVYCDLSRLGKDKAFRIGTWELPLAPEDIVWDEDKEHPEKSRWQPIIHGHRVIRHQYFFDSNQIIDLPVISNNL